jgi:MFS family permease
MNALTCGIPRAENRAGHFTLLGFCMIAANSAGPVLVGWMFDIVPYRPGFAILGLAALAATGVGYLLLRDVSSRAVDFH